MPSKTPGKLKIVPRFRSEQEEVRFWDTHDSTDFLEELTPDVETVFVRPENGVIEVGPQTWRRILAEAKRRKTTPDRLIESCIQKGLRQPQL